MNLISSSNLKLILSKLPYKLKEKWRTTAYELLEKNKKRAGFSDLVSFIETQAKILQDPLFGEIQEAPRRVYSKPTVVSVDTKTQQRPQKNKSSSFVMSVNNCKSTCCICGRTNHSIDQCEKLKTQPHDIKVQLLKNNGICFGCLNKGHLSKSCTRRMTCEYCQGKHPSVLHIHRTQDNDGQFKSANVQQKQSVSGTLFPMETEQNGDAVAGEERN